MTRYVKLKHSIAFEEKRVGTALFMVSPQSRAPRRTSVIRTANLILCRADYFGHKLHIDQNEKLIVQLLSPFFVKLFNLQTIVTILRKLSVLIFATFHLFMFWFKTDLQKMHITITYFFFTWNVTTNFKKYLSFFNFGYWIKRLSLFGFKSNFKKQESKFLNSFFDLTSILVMKLKNEKWKFSKFGLFLFIKKRYTDSQIFYILRLNFSIEKKINKPYF